MDSRTCPFCAEQIKAAAIKCKHCGSLLTPQTAGEATPAQQPQPYQATPQATAYQGTLWLPVPALVLGILSFLALFDDSYWDLDTIIGLIMFSGTGLVLGILGTTIQKKGRGMAIAGIVLCSIGLLASLGLLAEF